MVLRWHWINRWGSLIPAGIVATAAVVATVPDLMSRPRPGAMTVLILFTVIPAYLAARSFRAGVVLYPDRIIVRRWIWSRSIPRDRVVELTRMKFIAWTTRSGRRRVTPLAMFWEYARMTEGMTSANTYALSAIRSWIRGAEPREPRHRSADA